MINISERKKSKSYDFVLQLIKTLFIVISVYSIILMYYYAIKGKKWRKKRVKIGTDRLTSVRIWDNQEKRKHILCKWCETRFDFECANLNERTKVWQIFRQKKQKFLNCVLNLSFSVIRSII